MITRPREGLDVQRVFMSSRGDENIGE